MYANFGFFLLRNDHTDRLLLSVYGDTNRELQFVAEERNGHSEWRGDEWQ